MDDQLKETMSLLDEISSLYAESIFNTIQMLSTIFNFMERYYEGSHSRFISEKSEKICKALGMNDTDIFEIKTAALLHDIGKVGMKESILYRRSNELNESELKQYCLHPELGNLILRKHKGFSTIAEIVYQHHEKLDGTGFPRHLKKAEIHPGASIIHVVDYFHDAMYKKNRDQRIAIKPSAQITGSFADSFLNREVYASTMNFLHQKKGILFERRVVELFTEILELERKNVGGKAIMRVPVNMLEPGMTFAKDYYTTYGLLIASNGEAVTEDMKSSLIRFAETEQIPMKVLVIK
ncbi:MAG: HD domain-containing protein [Candidatus Kapabacteria bacterium]|nr:HD domain-containing protein [Candidatus Kapabacteria bacterium]